MIINRVNYKNKMSNKNNTSTCENEELDNASTFSNKSRAVDGDQQ